jgi:hypothetical protein
MSQNWMTCLSWAVSDKSDGSSYCARKVQRLVRIQPIQKTHAQYSYRHEKSISAAADHGKRDKDGIPLHRLLIFDRSGMAEVNLPWSRNLLLGIMALYDATKLIGYNFRDYNMEHITEYYLWHRDLVFEKFKVTLRNSILATLNDGITRAGKELGFSSQIEIKGLPTEDDVAAAQEKLAVGDGTFEEILKTFRYY